MTSILKMFTTMWQLHIPSVYIFGFQVRTLISSFLPLGVVSITQPLQFSLQSAPTADQPVFTLTCISTGGPATTVTWTRDRAPVFYDADHVLTQTVTDTLASTYSSVLTVTGGEPGSYQCSITNARGSSFSQSLMVEG